MFKTFLTNINTQRSLNTIIHKCRDISPSNSSSARKMSFQQDYSYSYPSRINSSADEQLIPKYSVKPSVTFTEPMAFPFYDNQKWFDRKVQREKSKEEQKPKVKANYDLMINMVNFRPAEIKIFKVPGHRIEVVGKQNGAEIVARYMVPLEYQIDQLKAQYREGFLVIQVPKMKNVVDYSSIDLEKNKSSAFSANFSMKKAFKPEFIQGLSPTFSYQ